MDKVKVLMIDDNVGLIEAVKEYFKSSKQIEIIDEAHDGVEGFEKIKNEECDVVVLDLIMPKKDGLYVLDELSKKFEETKTGQVKDLISYYMDEGNPKGELVLVISRSNEENQEIDDVETLIRKTLETCSARDTADLVAKATGIHKKEIYKKVLDIQHAEKKEV